jgi:hypothetical protein
MKRLLLAALLAGWFSCSPGYESGKTLCRSESPRCPDGFVCSGRVCVTPDQVGTGGRTGTGGRSGTGGTPDPGYCTPSSADTACQACSKLRCCNELTACYGNSACLGLANCLANCSTASCESDCETTYSAGLTLALNLGLCGQTNCASECSIGGSGGSTGGTGGQTTGGGGSVGPSTGSATIKFCHGLSTSSSPSLALTLDLNGTKVTATTGNCQPTGSCLTVPAGPSIPVTVTNGSTTFVSSAIDLEVGAELLVEATLDSSGSPMVTSSPAQGICSGGTGTSGTLAKFCNFLTKNDSDFVVTLQIGGTSISALTGSCSPVGMCSSITSGSDVPFSLLDGSTALVSGTFPTIDSGSNTLFRSKIDTDGMPNINGMPYATGICSAANGSSALLNPIDPVISSPAVKGDLRTREISAIRDRASPIVPAGVYRSMSDRDR